MKTQWLTKFFSAIMIVILAFVALPVTSASADVTDELVPTGDGNYTFWTNNWNEIEEGTTSAVCTGGLIGDNIISNTNSQRESVTISLASIPNGSTITGINVLARDKAFSAVFAGGTYATFIRLNGTDSGDSAIHAVAAPGVGGTCSGSQNDNFVANTVKNAGTTLEIGAIKINSGGNTNNFVYIGALSAVITYTLPPAHTITASAGAGGSITPSGAVVVYEGSPQTFDITPSASYIVSNVSVDSVPLAGFPNAYTFINVTTDHAISAAFNGGWSQPANNTGGGWANENGAYVSDNDFAVANGGGDVTQYHDFGLAIPLSATINGIEVAIEGNAVNNREVVVDLSWNAGGNFTSITSTTAFTNGGADATLVLGGPAITWNHTWNPATEFSNNNFRVRLDVTGGGGINGNLNIDQIQVKVYYTLPNTPPTGGNDSVTAIEDTLYTFQTSDFTYNDPDSNPFAGIRITSLETAGDLECGGVDVNLNGTCADVATLTFNPDLNFSGLPSPAFGFQVFDGTAYSASSYTMTIGVTAVNDIPVVNAATFSLDENSANGTSVGTATYNDVDAGQTHTFSITGGNTGGAFAINPSTGEITVATSSALDFETNPTFSLTVQVTDNGSPILSGTNTVTINLNDANDAPAGTDNTVTTNEDTAYTFAAADFGFTDVDAGDVMSEVRIDILTLAPGSTLRLLGVDVVAAQSIPTASIGNLVFTPALNANGAGYASFTFSVRDTNGPAFDASPNTMTIDVTATNDAPATSNVVDTTNEDTAKSITLVYTDTESDLATSCSVSGLSSGSISTACACAAGVCTVGITPDLNSTAQVTANYTVDDGAASNSSTITLNIAAVDDAPVTSNVVDTTNEDTAKNITLAYTDPESDLATSCSVSGLSSGSISTACACAAGVCTVGITPDLNSTAQITANYTVDNGAASNSSTITLDVIAVNDAPVTSNVTDTTNEDTAISVTLAYTDVESNQATSCSVSGLSSGSISTACACAAGVCTVGITPDLNSTAQVTANYTVDDGATSNTSTITLDVTTVNDLPVGTDNTVTTNEDTAYTFAAVDFGFTDVDAGDVMSEVRIDILTLAPGSTLRLLGVDVVAAQSIPAASIGSLVFTPASNANGAGYASFTFSVRDTGGPAFDAAPNTMTINVTAVNDAPVTSSVVDATNEDTAKSITLAYTDVESNQATSCSVSGLSSGSISTACACAAGVCTVGITPALNSTAQITANYTVDDGAISNSSTITLDVTAVNDAPDGTNNTVTTNEDTAYTFAAADFGFTDVDAGDVMSEVRIDILTLAPGSTLRLLGVDVVAAQSIPTASIGSLVFTPASNANGAGYASFTFSVRDTNGPAFDASPNTMTINVTAANDAPVTSNVVDTTNEDTAKSITLAYTDTESDLATSCSVSGLSSGSISTACACAAGVCAVGITPALNSTAQITANYTVDDGATSNTSTITLDVTPLDDVPLAVNDTITVPGNTTSMLNVLTNDTDVDGGTKQVASVSAAAHGTATNNTTDITYQPTTGYCGPDSFTYTVNGGSTATVNLDVACSPVFTSADTTSFDAGFAGSFNITATGNPSTMTISLAGTLPSGVNLVDNGNGAAVLSGTPPVGSNGTYPLVLTANNGVSPNGTQNFTLVVKNGPIIGANGVNSTPDTGDGSIGENESIIDTLGLTKLTVQFSQDVNDPTGDTDVKDVTNPANYMLVRSASTTFATIDCKGGVVAPDIAISVDSVTYSDGTPSGSGPFVATLSVNGGLPLNVVGFYRLYVCGTTSIVDAANTNLILAGNGATPGTDFQRNFRIATAVVPTVDGAGGGSNSASSKTLVTSNFLIPVTGFAPNQVTALPAQPADIAYASLGQMTIEIPTLGIKFPIVGASITNKTWDLTWLKDNVAYLEGSAYPTTGGNTVLTAHVQDANKNLGPFSDIKGLQVGQNIYIHVNGQTYVYQVQESRKISPTGIMTMFKHEEDSWITLVTCEDFNAKTGLYSTRRMVRAVLISVIPSKK